jgi:hypothetical protein
MATKLDLIEQGLDDGLPEDPRPMTAGSMVTPRR